MSERVPAGEAAERHTPPTALRWLFVTRKFPPTVGGMETLAAGIWRALADLDGSRLVVHRGTNRSLPLFLPRALASTRRLVRTGAADAVLSSDALMFAALTPVLRGDRPRVTIVHGLDLTWPRRSYQAVLHRTLPTADLVLANSNTTADLAARTGVAAGRIRVIPLGMPAPTEQPSRDEAREAIARRYGIPDDTPILATVGRLVPRKGVGWLIDEVLPKLRRRPALLVAGDGPFRSQVEERARRIGAGADVRLIGKVSDAVRDQLMCGADLFVQPNIVVPDDIEGFGLVTVEAAMRGAVVLASDIDGLRDAVVPGSTGYMLPAGDAARWVDSVDGLLDSGGELARSGERFRREALRLYSQERMARELHTALAEVEHRRG